MARKQILTNTVSQYLETDNQGSIKSRQFRQLALMKIVNDFYSMRNVPATWYALTAEHVGNLVSFWQKKGLKEATIMNYLVCLRYFLKKIGNDLVGIDNKTLNLKKIHNSIKPAIDVDDILNKIEEPIAFLLFSLQVRFGLTLHEAMNLIPGIHAHEGELWITREISVNHKDRIVPLVNTAQDGVIQILINLVGFQQSLLSRFGEPHLRRAWSFALSTLKLPTHISYRYLYAKTRFKELCHQYGPRDSKKMVVSETNINPTNPLWARIHE